MAFSFEKVGNSQIGGLQYADHTNSHIVWNMSKAAAYFYAVMLMLICCFVAARHCNDLPIFPAFVDRNVNA